MSDFQGRLLRRRASIALLVVGSRLSCAGKPVVFVPRFFGLARELFESYALFTTSILADREGCLETKTVTEGLTGFPFT